MSQQQTTDITETLPTMEPSTRSKVKKTTTIAIGVVGALLLIDDQVKRFKARKSVKLTVVDKPQA